MQRQKRHLLSRGDMEHMHALACLRGLPQQPLGRGERRLRIAPLAMARWVALALQGDALAKPCFVLGVKGGAPPDRGEDVRQGLLVIDEKVSGGGA